MRRTQLALLAAALAAYLFLLGPLVIVIGAAFSDTTFLAFPPQGLSLRWFANVVNTNAFRTTFVTSLEVAALSTLIALVIGLPAAYALNRFRGGLPRWLANLFVLPILVPDVVLGFAMLSAFGVHLGLPLFATLLIGHTVLVLPYAVRVVSAALASFDFAAEEAAISLGSPPVRTFFTVVLPNIRSGMLAAFILAFITSLNNVPMSLFLTGPGVSTLPIQMLTYVENFFDPTVAALSVMLMLLTVIVMLVVERTLGLTYFTR